MAYTELGDAMKRGYSIQYDSGKAQQGRRRSKTVVWRAMALVLAVFCVYGMLQCGFFKRLHSDVVSIVSALEQFAGNCRDGTSVTDAFAAFCREILYGV